MTRVCVGGSDGIMKEDYIEDIGKKVVKMSAIGIRVTPEDRVLIEVAAKADGRKASSWMRWVAVRIARGEAVLVDVPQRRSA